MVIFCTIAKVNPKSLIALLVLANYVFLAGMGCISRPEQDKFLVLIQTRADASQHYESSRYLRTSALEAFMAESLAKNYKKASDNHNPHIISVITGIDAHFLPKIAVASFAGTVLEKNTVFREYESGDIRTIALAIDAPPERA